MSIRTAQADWKRADVDERRELDGEAAGQPPQTTWQNVSQPSAQERNSRPVVIAIEAVSPMRRPNRPAIAAPSSGASTSRVTMSWGVIAA